MKVRYIAGCTVEYLKSLPLGTEISTSEAIGRVFCLEYLPGGDYILNGSELSFGQFMKIDELVRKQAKRSGLILDASKYFGQVVGLPFHIPYIVKHR